MPNVSVIIPIYNTEKYLKKCLDSVCNQTLSDIEIICINDKSEDNSAKIVQEYAKKDGRIKFIDLVENGGVSKARNIGIDCAKGEYIGFVDSDDFIDLDFYEKLYNKAINTNADSVKGSIYEYNSETEKSALFDFYNINEKIRENRVNFLYGFTSAIYKTDFIRKNNIGFPENITHFEDPYFSISVTLNSPKIETVDDARYFYVTHPNQASKNTKTLKKTVDFVTCEKSIINKINKYEISKEDYILYTSFLINNLRPWCYDEELAEEANIAAFCGVFDILKKAKFDVADIIQNNYYNPQRPLADKIKENRETIDLLEKYKDKLIEKYVVPSLSDSSKTCEDVYFISVVNDYKMYDQCIGANPFVINAKNIKLVDFDNTKENITIPKRYNSFLNGYDFNKSAWFVFCHCDWEVMEDINRVLAKLDKNKIYGPIGSRVEIFGNKLFRMSTGSCYEKRRDGSGFRFIGIKNTESELTDTFDCQAMFVHSDLIKKYNLRFDENLTWDLYVEDFCIGAKTKYGIESYTSPIECCHWSGYHVTPPSYYKSLEYVNKKYPNGTYGGTVSLIGNTDYQIATNKDILFYQLRKRHLLG